MYYSKDSEEFWNKENYSVTEKNSEETASWFQL